MQRIRWTLLTVLLLASDADAQTPAPMDADLASIDARVAQALAMFELPAKPQDPAWVQQAIRQMSDADQLARHGFGRLRAFQGEDRERWRLAIVERVERVDRSNLERLRSILPAGGWFRISVVGEDTARDAWLLVQHADRDVAFQKEMLARMMALPDDEVEPRLIAYLYDRVAMNESRPQRYGTQGRCLAGGGWAPHELEEPDNVDALRATVGLGPLNDYIRGFDPMCP